MGRVNYPMVDPTRPVPILSACPCSRAAPTREVPGVCDPSPPRLRAHSQLEAGAGWQLVCPNVFALYGLRRPICPWTRLQPTTAPSNSRRGWDGTRPAEPVVTSGVGAQRADSVLVNHSKDSLHFNRCEPICTPTFQAPLLSQEHQPDADADAAR